MTPVRADDVHGCHDEDEHGGLGAPAAGGSLGTVRGMADSDPRLTRRGLFRGLGTAALVAGCKPKGESEAPEGVAPPDATGATVSAEPSPLRFVLNGEEVELSVQARTTLAQALRLDLDRTGTKISCDRGACGACMVLVDGEAHNSCMTLAHDVGGRSVETVEGLGGPDHLSALQRAFVEHDALQCGFCTSGMLISSEALLREHRATGKKLDAEDVKACVAGNLCRCGTYPHVVSAVLSVAGGGA